MPKVVDHQERKDGIAAAVTRAAAKHGFSGVSFGNVAEESGMSKSLVRHYFPTRDEMIMYSLSWMHRGIDQTMQEAIAANSDVSYLGTVRTILHAILPRTEEQKQRAVIASVAFVLELQQHDIRQKFADGHQELIRGLHQLLKKAKETEDVQMEHPRQTALALISLVDGLSSQLVLDYISIEDAQATLDASLDRLCPTGSGTQATDSSAAG